MQTTLFKTSQNPLQQILKLGQSIWYDGLISKEEFQRLIREDGLRGATTNPTIFEKSLSTEEGSARIRSLVSAMTAEQAYKTVAVKAVQEIADVFMPVYQDSGGEDGFVSMEVSPLLATDTEATVAEALELYRSIRRKNVMIKIPATAEGIPAIRAVLAEGVPVNVTLIFSVQRYRQVMDAYLGGLEKRLLSGRPIADCVSVASFFVSRVDTSVDKILEQQIASGLAPGRSELLNGLLGKAAIANSKIAYEEFEKTFAGDRFRKLKAAGARLQRPLWASTGTKNPRYSDVYYVEALMGPHTVDTIPPATLAAFRDHGAAASRLKQGTDRSHEVMSQLKACDIDLEKITGELEKSGVQLFSDSYLKIIQCIESKK